MLIDSKTQLDKYGRETSLSCPVCNTDLCEKSFCAFCDDEIWFIDDRVIRRGKA